MNTGVPKLAMAAGKYAGLLKVAGIGGVTKAVINEGSYWLPGVGTARMGVDALKDFGRVFRRGATAGQRFGALGSGLANSLFSVASLAGLGFLGRIGKLGRMGRAAAIAARGGRQAAAASRIAKGLESTGRIGRFTARMAGRLPTHTLAQMGQVGQRATQLGRRAGGFRGMVAGMGLGIGSGMLEGAGGMTPGQAVGHGAAAYGGPGRYQGLYNQYMGGGGQSAQPFSGMPSYPKFQQAFHTRLR